MLTENFENEILFTYKIGDEAYLQIQRIDDGINYDFSLFRQDNYKLMDGGVTDFDIADRFASMTLFDIVKEIADDFCMKTDDITIADESINEAIEEANRIENPISLAILRGYDN